MTVVLPGAEWVGHARSGGTFAAGMVPKYCGHTVEGYSSNPVATARAHPWPPHLWYCPAHDPYNPRRLLQTISLDRSAYALAHPAGTPETNRAGFIQCEVFGYAAESGNWPRASLDAYAEDVIVPICEAAAIDPAVFLDTGGPNWYGPGPHRIMAPDPGYQMGGLWTHQRVWANDHWDMGRLNIRVVSAKAVKVIGAPSAPPVEEVDWEAIVRYVNARKYLVIGG